MPEKKVGVVTHYWGKIGVAGLKITDGELRVGDTIHVKGHTSDFTQQVESMQIESDPIQVANPGDDVGLKVSEHAHEHDQVFKVIPD
jgi:putative protease